MGFPTHMRFCSHCGSSKIVYKNPKGDKRPRHSCESCGAVFYENPKIVAGCIPVWKDSVLMCKRAIEPRYGLWTLPAGFMENGESTLQAAERETSEEACAKVKDSKLFALFNLPQINQVYMMFVSELVALDFSPGEETLECCLYEKQDIPWDSIAFPTITYSLKFFFEDRKSGAFKLHCGDVFREGSSSQLVAHKVLE